MDIFSRIINFHFETPYMSACPSVCMWSQFEVRDFAQGQVSENSTYKIKRNIKQLLPTAHKKVSHVTCQLSRVRCHKSYVTCHMAHVSPKNRAGGLTASLLADLAEGKLACAVPKPGRMGSESQDKWWSRIELHQPGSSLTGSFAHF